MKIDIYHSISNGRKYLSVRAGIDVTTLQLPADTDKDLLKLSVFRSEHDIQPGRPYIGLDANDVIRQIEERGYAIHGAKVEITVSEGGRQA